MVTLLLAAFQGRHKACPYNIGQEKLVKEIFILPAVNCRCSQRVLAYLDENQVAYTRIDLDTEKGQRMMAEYELRSSPGILVDGVLVNPFDILEAPSCRIKETAARQLFGLEEVS
jgi:glutaredoxin